MLLVWWCGVGMLVLVLVLRAACSCRVEWRVTVGIKRGGCESCGRVWHKRRVAWRAAPQCLKEGRRAWVAAAGAAAVHAACPARLVPGTRAWDHVLCPAAALLGQARAGRGSNR